MNPVADFVDLYFAFLLSGNVSDFTSAHGAMVTALECGVSWEALQRSMDQNHAMADMMLVIQNVMVEEINRG
jgi:hypothetical protein